MLLVKENHKGIKLPFCFFEGELKLVDIKNEQIKEFTKNTSSESQLK